MTTQRFALIAAAALAMSFSAAQAQQSPAMPRTWQVPFMSPGSADANLGAFYNEFRCGEDPSNTNPATCSDPQARTFDMVVNWRRCDWGGIQATSYYQCLDSYLSRDGGEMLQALSFAPFKAYNPTNGDGGDILLNDGATVWIEATHDGSDPPDALQYFCSAVPGFGWVMMNIGDGISTTAWSGETDRISATFDPSACAAIGSSYNQWTGGLWAVPFLVYGQPETRTLALIVSQHFAFPVGVIGSGNVAQAVSAEMQVNAEGYGPIGWYDYVSDSNPTPPSALLAQRCPWAPFAPPVGMRLIDCRLWTQIVEAPPNWSGATYGWAP